MRIYVGTYAKYNDGNLFGKWLYIENYSDKEEFLKACAELHSDEEDPELMFQDWEGVPDDMVSECWLDPECWELIEAYDEFDEDAVKAYIYCFGEWNRGDFQDRYRGEYDSWKDFAEQLVDELGYLYEIPEHLRYYFDYEKYARDLRLGGDVCEHDGYYFWNN